MSATKSPRRFANSPIMSLGVTAGQIGTSLRAAVVFVTVPSVQLFYLGQEEFIRGIATGGMK